MRTGIRETYAFAGSLDDIRVQGAQIDPYGPPDDLPYSAPLKTLSLVGNSASPEVYGIWTIHEIERNGVRHRRQSLQPPPQNNDDEVVMIVFRKSLTLNEEENGSGYMSGTPG